MVKWEANTRESSEAQGLVSLAYTVICNKRLCLKQAKDGDQYPSLSSNFYMCHGLPILELIHAHAQKMVFLKFSIDVTPLFYSLLSFVTLHSCVFTGFNLSC